MDPFINDLVAYWPQILTGLQRTLMLMVIISVSGIAGGVCVFYLKLVKNKTLRKWTEAYISFFIGTPLLVHLFLMYYGLPQLGIRLSAFTVAVIGFTLNVSAYNARYLTTAYNGLDKSELEAAHAQGFTHFETFHLIILPQVMRLSVPSLTNQVIQNLKDTSVAFLIQYHDFFAQMQEIAATNFHFFKAYMTATLVYLTLVSVVVLVARRMERSIALPGFET
ncbi:MAG TPA: amino acid ABC transporter permease [Desulfobacteraceae bacterium]|nr:amino acid ABC transporter permease [Desulfobacteraceae bacterium]HPJ68942.1 amino acid ABC transporter permease [Desulfobacteraceae bacterium]HPQ29597.1 amino acid ABC transporter permease [Desulfobacteraceae bacterium]